jgi:hypothetical protein
MFFIVLLHFRAELLNLLIFLCDPLLLLKDQFEQAWVDLCDLVPVLGYDLQEGGGVVLEICVDEFDGFAEDGVVHVVVVTFVFVVEHLVDELAGVVAEEGKGNQDDVEVTAVTSFVWVEGGVLAPQSS